VRVRLGIVADDLTGANAVGAQLAETSLPSIVTSDPAALAAWAADLPAAVLNVDSRADGPERAAQKVRAAVAALREWEAGIFYKKTDSTLRGNLGAEIDAFREAAGAALLPALGATGTLIEGVLAPSVPLGRLQGGRCADLPVVTKPGGWGEEAVLVAAVRALRRTRSLSVPGAASVETP